MTDLLKNFSPRAILTRAQRPLATVLLCGATVLSLQGCIEMAIGTAVVGTLAATDTAWMRLLTGARTALPSHLPGPRSTPEDRKSVV